MVHCILGTVGTYLHGPYGGVWRNVDHMGLNKRQVVILHMRQGQDVDTLHISLSGGHTHSHTGQQITQFVLSDTELVFVAAFKYKLTHHTSGSSSLLYAISQWSSSFTFPPPS